MYILRIQGSRCYIKKTNQRIYKYVNIKNQDKLYVC